MDPPPLPAACCHLPPKSPSDPLAPARADLLWAMRTHGLAPGRQMVPHPYRNASVLAQAFRQEVPLTVHPGIGYDIIANHPMFNGAAIGRAAAIDFRSYWAGSGSRGYGIHTVAMFGTAMPFDVWFRLWPSQRRFIQAVKADLAAREHTTSDPAPAHAGPLWPMGGGGGRGRRAGRRRDRCAQRLPRRGVRP